MASEGLLAALEAALKAIEKLGARYALVGGAAMPAWGRVRATHDADVLLGLTWSTDSGKRAVESLIGAFRGGGFAHLEKADRRRLGEKLVLRFWFPLRPQGLSVGVDAILLPGPEGEEVISRARPRKIDGFEAWVASCEDLILLKLAAGRPVDVTDAQDLIAINREGLDWGYLEARAERWGLRKEIEQVRAKTEP